MRAARDALLTWQCRVESEYRLKMELPDTLRDTNYPEELSIVLGMTTRWVAAALYAQFHGPGISTCVFFRRPSQFIVE
ncbi:hypothetical protein GQ600_4226 [Phytophthora cactorum]|nr:hypothetical protein GQ600_7608 [Phytophthora cactorum]KAF1786313.1 hypothetical protein GQ600_4226 [Phytophthora cactorum]